MHEFITTDMVKLCSVRAKMLRKNNEASLAKVLGIFDGSVHMAFSSAESNSLYIGKMDFGSGWAKVRSCPFSFCLLIVSKV